MESVFRDLPAITLDEVQTRMYLNGVRLDADRLAEKPPLDELVRVYGNGEFLGVAKVNEERELVSVKRFINE